MSTITREQLRERAREKVKSLEFAVTQTAFADSRSELEEELELARIALASLEAGAVYFVEIEDGQDINAGRIEGKNRPDLSLLPDGINHLYAAPPAPANAEPVAWLWSNRKHPSEVTLVRPEDDEKAEGAHWSGWSCQALYAEPPAPVSVADEGLLHMAASAIDDLLSNKDRSGAGVWVDIPAKLRRAVMLQGADGNSPVIPDGYALVPMKLTAENGAKGALLGEFSETKFINCPECFGDDECDTCDGSGRIETKVQVSWTNIKAIWDKGIEHFSSAPKLEVKS